MNDSSSLVFDVTVANFPQLVIQRSMEVPVIVDFWASWCAPCRILSPVLEEVVRSHKGKVVLGKVDVDSNQSLSNQFGIRGIPAVKIFMDGKVVKEFVGAVSQPQIEKLLEEILPDEDAPKIEQANLYLSGGRWEEAAKIYESVLEDNPDNSPANLGLGMTAFHQARWDDAEKYLSKVESDTPGYEDVPAMLARIYFEKIDQPDLNAVTKKLQKNSQDTQALYSLALIYARGGEYKQALDTLLEVINHDRDFQAGAAKDAYLKILDILGRNSPEGKSYFRKFSMILFS